MVRLLTWHWWVLEDNPNCSFPVLWLFSWTPVLSLVFQGPLAFCQESAPPILMCQTHLVQDGDPWSLGQLSLQQGVWVDSSWFHVGDVAREQIGQADA